MAKFILCDCCRQPIYFGDEIYTYAGYCGTFCSAECFAHIYANTDELTEEHAENCMCKIYDDEIIEKKKAELRANIEQMQRELKLLEDTTK